MEADEYIAWKRWDERPFGQLDGRYRSLFRAELAKAGGGPLRDVLEIGFGNGEFLAYARDLGASAVGVDTNVRLVEAARQAGFEAFTDLAEVPVQAAFDLVAAFDVLEHIDQDQIPGVLRDLRDRLRPGGAIVARFPNGDSPFSLASQNGDVTHRSAIGSQKIRYLAREAELELEYCGATSLPVRGAPPARAAYAIVAGPLRWLIGKFLALLFLQRTDVTLDANLTVVMRRPRRGSSDAR